MYSTRCTVSALLKRAFRSSQTRTCSESRRSILFASYTVTLRPEIMPHATRCAWSPQTLPSSICAVRAWWDKPRVSSNPAKRVHPWMSSAAIKMSSCFISSVPTQLALNAPAAQRPSPVAETSTRVSPACLLISSTTGCRGWLAGLSRALPRAWYGKASGCPAWSSYNHEPKKPCTRFTPCIAISVRSSAWVAPRSDGARSGAGVGAGVDLKRSSAEATPFFTASTRRTWYMRYTAESSQQESFSRWGVMVNPRVSTVHFTSAAAA